MIFRVLRGGSFNSGIGYLRSSIRRGFSPLSRYEFDGFRLIIRRMP